MGRKEKLIIAAVAAGVSVVGLQYHYLTYQDLAKKLHGRGFRIRDQGFTERELKRIERDRKKWEEGDDNDDDPGFGTYDFDKVRHRLDSDDMPAGVDKEFDEYVAVLGFVAVLAMIAVGMAMRNNGGRSVNSAP